MKMLLLMFVLFFTVGMKTEELDRRVLVALFVGIMANLVWTYINF